MNVVILEEFTAEAFREQRKSDPAYRWDEIWDGTYMIFPIPDIWHSSVTGLFMVAFFVVYRETKTRGCGHVNVSDRNGDWVENVRCPDAAVFLEGNPVRDRTTHYQGGPDFLVEIAMPRDRCREKLDFYASIGTREVLVIDRKPWRFELYRRKRDKLRLDTTTYFGDKPLRSQVIPFTFEFVRKRRGVTIKIVHTETGQEWVG